MSLVATVKALLAAGASAEMIVAAVEAVEASRDDALSKRRASDAARQQAKRDRDNNVTSRDVTTAVNGPKKSMISQASAPVRVSEYITNSENNHLAAAVAKARDVQPIDDWPDGSAQDHAKLIYVEIASPWLDPDKSGGLVTSAGRLASWKRDGASWEHDVLPIIRARLAKRRGPISSWTFFDGAIAENMAANRAALAMPEVGTIVPFRGQGPPSSFAAQLGAEQAEARRRAFEIMDARDAKDGRKT